MRWSISVSPTYHLIYHLIADLHFLTTLLKVTNSELTSQVRWEMVNDSSTISYFICLGNWDLSKVLWWQVRRFKNMICWSHLPCHQLSVSQSTMSWSYLIYFSGYLISSGLPNLLTYYLQNPTVEGKMWWYEMNSILQ